MEFPQDFTVRERALLGARFDELYAYATPQPARGVTVNALRCTPEWFAQHADFDAKPSPFCPTAFTTAADFRPGRHAWHHAGVLYAQEPSASAPAELLDVQPGMRVADLCAAPGGKSFSAACYFYAMTPLLGIPVCVEHVHFESLQGDVEFLHILEKMGCSAQETENGVLLLPPAGQTDTGTQVPAFHGITVDMSSCSDQAITLAAIAPFADSPTCITGIGHIRFQESDRIHAICTELTRMGIHCEETQDSITIYPGMPHPCTVATYDDHRMAMGFALTGLRAEGIVIDDPGCCRKTFENYFEVLDQVIAKIIEM